MANTEQALNKAREALEEALHALSLCEPENDPFGHKFRANQKAQRMIKAALQPSAPAAQADELSACKEKIAALQADLRQYMMAADTEARLADEFKAELDALKAERHVLTEAIEDLQDVVSKAMRRAWQLGQTYWQQADSEYTSHHKKADETQRKFEALVDETRKALLSTAPQVEQVEAKEGEQHVWIAYNSKDDDEPVMFFTEQPGQELKDRFFLKHYICRPAAPSAQKEGEQP